MSTKVTIPVQVYNKLQLLTSFDVVVENFEIAASPNWPERKNFEAAAKAYAEALFAPLKPCIMLGRMSTERCETVGVIKQVFVDDTPCGTKSR